MVTYLAIDYGDRRTGLAVGDDQTGIASPVDVLEHKSMPAAVEQLRGAIAEHQPDALVVGLPLNMDGSDSPRARLVRKLATELEPLGLPIHLQDERLTSYAADQQMNRTGLTHQQKKRLRDALAAAALLRDFLEQR